MRSKKNKEPRIVGPVEITGVAAEGMAMARVDGKVVFIPFGAPGDVVDAQLFRRKKNFSEARIVHFHHRSELRTPAPCPHFTCCGGCKWQHLPYPMQLDFKKQQVVDALERIAKIPFPPVPDVIPSDKPYFYRNKLEFTFSSRPWIDFDQPESLNDGVALGFHLPGRFDRILDLQTCLLQPDPCNEIRLAVREFAVGEGYSFYDQRTHEGFLRNLMVRNTRSGSFMVVVAFGYEDEPRQERLLSWLKDRFPAISALMYYINPKLNDSFFDLPVISYAGPGYLEEELDGLRFRIGPKSFFQTNADQALALYRVALDFANLKGHETVYDLYTGTGTIANFVARKARLVIGIESVDEAIVDARKNSELNGIGNTRFLTGTIEQVLDAAFFTANGHPDVVIIDPPRAGMHPKVVKNLLEQAIPRIVYVSCNPSTQARDAAMLAESYRITRVQPVDMFPQTHHIENVILLERREEDI